MSTESRFGGPIERTGTRMELLARMPIAMCRERNNGRTAALVLVRQPVVDETGDSACDCADPSAFPATG